MATIRTAIQITDGLSPAIRSMNRALGMVIGSFEQLQRESSQPVNLAGMRAARDELAKAEASFNQLEEEIRQSSQQQENFNRQMQQGTAAAKGMGGAIRSAFIAIGGTMAVKALGDQVDEYASIQARLSLINDGQQTAAELNSKIMASANRARVSYEDVAASVSKLGVTASAAFNNNDEMIRFSELMGKNFKISGASVQEQTSAMYQLTQAMAAGRLQGDEFRSILENAPLLAQAIAKQMGLPMGQLKEMSSQGLITSDIIKAALFNSADEIEARFKQMPVTFADVANLIRNKVEQQMAPTYAALSAWVNSAQGSEAINSVSRGIVGIGNAVSWTIMRLMELYNFFTSNWPMIGPFVYTLAGAFLALKAATLGYNAVLAITAGLQTFNAARAAIATGATLAQVAATTTATGAQIGFNTALLACPLTWIILLIVAVVAAFYAMIGAMNKAAGTSISATGIITGVFLTAAALIGNVLLSLLQIVFAVVDGIVNQFIMSANFLGNVFRDPVGSVIHLFADMADAVLGTLHKIARVMDTIFGTSFASSVAQWRSGLSSMADTLANKYGSGEYTAIQKFSTEDALAKAGINIGRFGMMDAYSAGYKWGKNLKMPGFGAGTEADVLGLKLDGMTSALSGIGSDVSGIKDSVTISEEDLRYLRDIAEQEVINRFTTAEVKVEMSNTFGDIRETVDLDGVVAHLENKVSETLSVVAEGANSDV